MNDRTPPRRMTATEALRNAVQSSLPVDVGRQELVPMPPLSRDRLEALCEALDRLHTRATLGEPITWRSHELYALADAADLARAASRYGYPTEPLEQLAADARRAPHSRASDPSTSHAAGETKHGEPTHRNQLGRLVLAFRMWEQREPEDAGLTSEEAAQRAGLSLRSEYAKRCSELRDGGYLEPQLDTDGEEVTREGASGRQRIVWQLTDKGRRAAAELVDLDD